MKSLKDMRIFCIIPQNFSRNMMPILPKDEHCCGCSACFNACSHSSIKMIRDDLGFYVPFVDENTCTECKACEIACPTLPFLNFAPYNAVHKTSAFPLINKTGGGGLSKFAS